MLVDWNMQLVYSTKVPTAPLICLMRSMVMIALVLVEIKDFPMSYRLSKKRKLSALMNQCISVLKMLKKSDSAVIV